MSVQTPDAPMLPSPPWHPGEQALQARAGVAERMADIGRRVVRRFMPDQHRDFYSQLPFMILGVVDNDGQPWATMVTGAPGFVQSPDPERLRFAACLDATDPAAAAMANGAPVGLLGIELHSRRRNRINGHVEHLDSNGFEVAVEHSFGNCPRYIQLRDWTVADATPVVAEPLDRIDEEAAALIAAAESFYVASYFADARGSLQVDVSHRGGKAGFVRQDNDGWFLIPDFNGNLFFNTLGNILETGKAGLTFVDFVTGSLLQMTGDAEVLLDAPEIAAFQGSERMWRFRARHIVRRRGAVPLRWTDRPDSQSPEVGMTGSWPEVADRIAAAARATAWRPFRVARIVDESSVVRSFHLEPDDGAGLALHQAGQHLPIRLTLPGCDVPTLRTYTLSLAPSDGGYRISVKRQGRMSRYLHDTLAVGDVIEARAPAGSFVIDTLAQRPAVLIAAGIGITPMLAMARHLVYEGARRQRMRPVWLFYGARSRRERAFADELADLAARAKGVLRVIRTLDDLTDAQAGRDYDHAGRIDAALLKSVLPFDDYDFYLCGPPVFMQGLYDVLRDLNIADNRIHAEAFGPAALTRRADATGPVLPKASTTSVPVAFARSAKEARWTPGSGTLLELAEARGLAPEFSCRGGSCGTCRTAVLAGRVTYTTPPAAEHGDSEALICCAVPAAAEDGGGDRLILDL